MKPNIHTAAIAAFAVTLVLSAQSGHAAIVLTGTSNLNGILAGGDYTFASSIPVSTTDLINGLAASSTTYAGTNEAAGGTTVPFTDGTTGTGTAAATGPTTALFALNSLWQVTYTLPLPTNIGRIVVTSGHQDARLNQQYDLFTSTDGLTFTSLSGGAGFNYSPAAKPSNQNGEGGAAQSTVFDNANPILAAGVKAIRFQALDNGNGVFRELDVIAVPEPTSVVSLLSGLGLLALRRRR